MARYPAHEWVEKIFNFSFGLDLLDFIVFKDL